MTVDEELSGLDENIRRLKIEYDVYFGGGSKKPPTDLEWRIQNMLRKYSESRLNFAQRFRYNTLANRYALFNSLWQKKLRIKEEGYRRPQDAILSIQGVRQQVEQEPEGRQEPAAVTITCLEPEQDQTKLRQLFEKLQNGRREAGNPETAAPNFESFQNFIRQKTEQLRVDFGCNAVEYTVQVEQGKTRLKAKPKGA